MHSLPALQPFIDAPCLSSEERFQQYSEGEAIIAAAEDDQSGLSERIFAEMLAVGARMIRNANNGVRDAAVQA